MEHGTSERVSDLPGLYETNHLTTSLAYRNGARFRARDLVVSQKLMLLMIDYYLFGWKNVFALDVRCRLESKAKKAKNATSFQRMRFGLTKSIMSLY
jgi:hypothetical protein